MEKITTKNFKLKLTEPTEPIYPISVNYVTVANQIADIVFGLNPTFTECWISFFSGGIKWYFSEPDTYYLKQSFHYKKVGVNEEIYFGRLAQIVYNDALKKLEPEQGLSYLHTPLYLLAKGKIEADFKAGLAQIFVDAGCKPGAAKKIIEFAWNQRHANYGFMGVINTAEELFDIYKDVI